MGELPRDQRQAPSSRPDGRLGSELPATWVAPAGCPAWSCGALAEGRLSCLWGGDEDQDVFVEELVQPQLSPGK